MFLEKRCQGLSRFINCIVRHPVLKHDEEVVSFLTEQTVRNRIDDDEIIG